jgi:hypothetical protein
MRNQFYGDRKDVWKWSLLLKLAGQKHHIFQIAMLRPDKGTHGNDRRDPGACNHAVREFFDDERSQDAHDIKRIEKLLPGRITVLMTQYSNGCRVTYFDLVLEITRKTAPKVVFLDPDNGIEGATRGHEHIGVQEIERVWESLKGGDYLVVFQYSFFDSDWCAKKMKLLSETIGKHVETEPHPSMCYFWAQK